MDPNPIRRLIWAHWPGLARVRATLPEAQVSPTKPEFGLERSNFTLPGPGSLCLVGCWITQWLVWFFPFFNCFWVFNFFFVKNLKFWLQRSKFYFLIFFLCAMTFFFIYNDIIFIIPWCWERGGYTSHLTFLKVAPSSLQASSIISTSSISLYQRYEVLQMHQGQRWYVQCHRHPGKVFHLQQTSNCIPLAPKSTWYSRRSLIVKANVNPIFENHIILIFIPL